MRDLTKVPIKPCKYFTGHIHDAIDFQYSGSPRRGVRIQDILSNPGLVANGSESVLRGYGSIRLYLSWPGYSSIASFAVINCAQMSKARLALEICQNITLFLQKCASIPVSSASTRWRIGPGSYSAANVSLISIIDIGEGIWQVDLELDA